MKRNSLSFTAALRQFSSLIPIFSKNRLGLALGFASLLIVDGLQLVIPLIIKRAVDALTGRTASASFLFECALWIMGLAAAIVAFRYVWRFFLLGHSRKLEREIRENYFSHLQKMSPAFYGSMSTGDLMARATNDLNAVRMATGMGLAALTDGIIMGAATIGFMVAIDARLALITLIPAPFLVLFSRIYTRRMAATYERVQGRFGTLTERVREAFAGVRVIKAFGREDWTARRVRQQSRAYVDDNLVLARHLGIFFPMMQIFTNLGLALVIGFGGRLAILGDITTGDFVAFVTYLNLLAWPMMAMGWVTNLVQRGGAAMARINKVMETRPEILSRPGSLSPSLKGNLSARNLTFSYPQGKEKVLKDLCLDIPAGSFVALVGAVGCGKSTLLSLFPRMWDPEPESVFIDNLEVGAFDLEALRRQIGFVTQETVIFSDTILNNVLFGREHIGRQEALDALAQARFLEEVMEFEDQENTLLGERGITLSGGQRQRLALARALVEPVPVLILDDALSMVDSRTEEAIVPELMEKQGRTLVIVSHRTSTIKKADRILVMDQGRITESGDHETLLRTGKIYKKLYEIRKMEEALEGADQ